MKLSEVKLISLKNFANFDDNYSLTQDQVRQSRSDKVLDSKYNIADSNFWTAFNTFISQISSRDKLHPILAYFIVSEVSSNKYDMHFFTYDREYKKGIQVGRIYTVFIKRDNKTLFPSFRQVSNEKFVLYNFQVKVGDIIYVQFRPILPLFNQEDILLVKNDMTDDSSNLVDNDIDLYLDYGIDDNILDIGINYYIPALLNKDTDRDRYTNDLSIAQSLINNLEAYSGDALIKENKIERSNLGFRW